MVVVGSCPRGVQFFFPSTCKKIHDSTHGVVVLGAFSGVLLVFMAASMLLFGSVSCAMDDMWCVATKFIFAPLSAAFAIPVVMYCMRILQNFDQELQAKRKKVNQEKENLIKCYQGLLSEMESLLSKYAESASGLAERSFESKRRDFLRFLERTRSRFAVLTGDVDVLNQFRRFCINWLKVFEECSIDPINHPKSVLTSEELERCCSIAEVAEVCEERLRATEVRFISIQREQDAKMIHRSQGTLRRMTTPGHRGLPALASVPDEMTMAATAAQRRSPGYPIELTRGESSCGWLLFGGGFGFRFKKTQTGEDGYPKELSFGCGRLLVLSKQHVTLMGQFLFGWLLVVFQVYVVATIPQIEDPRRNVVRSPYYSSVTLTALSIVQFTLIVLLIKFEEIDTIQQLEREVMELKKQNTTVETQREKMGEFWSNAHQVTDLWLYRTVPRLDLYKELHSQLEDADEEDLLTNMAGANHMLEDLEANLGTLQAWQTDGQLRLDDKKMFGREINQLCQEADFAEILIKLEEVSNTGGMRRLNPSMH